MPAIGRHAFTRYCTWLGLSWIVLVATPPAIAQQAREAWLSFAPDQNRPAFQVTVNGEPTIAVIDSAISANAISTTLAERAGIKASRRSLRLRDINRGQDVPMSESFKLGLSHEGPEIEIDEAVMMPTGADVGVVFGRPLLNLFIVQIDYPNRQLRLLPRGAAEFSGNLKVRRGRHNQPMIEAKLDGEKVWMDLDTSNPGYCKMNHRAVEKQGWAAHGIESDQAGEFALRPDQRVLEFNKLEIGPYAINKLIASWVPEGEVADEIRRQHHGAGRSVDKTGADGILGYDVLRNFVVTMNMAEDEVHMFAP